MPTDDDRVRGHFLAAVGRVLRAPDDGRPVDAADEAAYTLTCLADVTPCAVQWLWAGRIPLGKLTVLDGDPGMGKSLLTLDLAARVSRGAAMPDGTTGHLVGPRGVILISAEDDPSDTIRPRLEAADAELARITILTGTGSGEAARPWTLADVGALRQAIAGTDAALVVIDPLMAHIPDARDTHRDHDIRRVLAPLAAMAAETQAAVVIVRHLRKSADGNPLHWGGGSIGIIGAARSGLLVANDPDDSDGGTRILAMTKSNLSAPAPSLRYRIAEAAPGVPRIEWLGESPHTASSALAAAQEDGQARTERDEAAEWLRTMLAGEPIPANQLLREARGAGHAERTLRRAAQRAGVLIARQGYPAQTVWSLASASARTDATAPVRPPSGVGRTEGDGAGPPLATP